MTVAALTPSISYVENGVSLAFAAPFRYLAPSQLVITRMLLDGTVSILPYGTAWTATPAPTDSGGTVTLAATVAGATLTIERATPRSQSTDYQTNDRFPAETHELALDRDMMIEQEQDLALFNLERRALRVPIGETVPPLAPRSQRIGYAAWDENGNLTSAPRPDVIVIEGAMPTVTTIAALQSITDRVDGQIVLVSGNATAGVDVGRAGYFRWRTGNFTSQVASDPLGGLYVVPFLALASAGAWERVWDGINGRPEWFRAKINDLASASANRQAIQACLDLCPNTVLGAGTYYTDATLAIIRSATGIQGAGQTQTDQGANPNASIIACTSATATILRVGNAGASEPTPRLETVHLRDFTVNRTVNPSTGTYTTATAGVSGANSIGIDVRWTVNCHFERVFSMNSAIAWNHFGTISMWYFRCSALRDKPSSTNPGAGDLFIGHHIDMSAPQTTNGGNASVHFTECRVFPLTGNATPMSAGMSIGWNYYQGWVDTFMTTCETGGGISYCVRGVGLGVNSAGLPDLSNPTRSQAVREENLRIMNCTFDPGSIACIDLSEGGANTAISIVSTYIAMGGNAIGINLKNLVGSVTMANNQFLCAVVGGIGVKCDTVNNVFDSGSIFTQIEKPYVLSNCNGGQIRGLINARGPGANIASSDAVNISACNRMIFSVTVNGQNNSFRDGYRVETASNNNLFECTGIGPAPLNGTKFRFLGTPITAESALNSAGLAGGNYARGWMT